MTSFSSLLFHFSTLFLLRLVRLVLLAEGAVEVRGHDLLLGHPVDGDLEPELPLGLQLLEDGLDVLGELEARWVGEPAGEVDLRQHDADVLRLVGHARVPYREVADREAALAQRRLARGARDGDLRVQLVLRDMARRALPLPVVRARPRLCGPVLGVHADERHVGHEGEALGRVRELDIVVHGLALVLSAW